MNNLLRLFTLDELRELRDSLPLETVKFSDQRFLLRAGKLGSLKKSIVGTEPVLGQDEAGRVVAKFYARKG